jgi:hypothetical protein
VVSSLFAQPLRLDENRKLEGQLEEVQDWILQVLLELLKYLGHILS